MAGDHGDLMDGEMHVGDVVVSHVNGTIDFYIIATVLSAIGDVTLRGVSTIQGQEAAMMRGYELQKDGQAVWLFSGSAAPYDKAPPAEQLMSRIDPGPNPDEAVQVGRSQLSISATLPS